VRNGLLGVSCALILVALTAARPVSTWGPLLRDFEAYWGAGRTYNAHDDPYGRAIWRAERMVPEVNPNHEEVLPFVGPPATLLLWGALARFGYQTASVIWWIVLVIALAALIGLSLRAAGAPVSAVSFLAGLALAIGFGPVTGDLALGQVAMIAFLGATIVAFHPQPHEGRLTVKTIASFIAFLQPNVSIGLISQLGRNRTTLAIVAGALVGYVVGALAFGWNWPIAYGHLVRSHEAGERFSAIQLTPAAIAYGFHLSAAMTTVVAATLAVMAVLGGAVIWRAVTDRFARFAAFSAMAPLVATFFHQHDLVSAYPAAIWCGLRTRGGVRIVALLGTILVAVDWLGLAQRPNAIVQSALLAGAAIAAFTALAERVELRGLLFAGIAIVTLFGGATSIAVAHPVPVWPYHLGAFAPPASWPIAIVWQQEQQRNGLQAAVPAWSLLRTLSLLGGALLALAIYRHSSYCRTASRYLGGNS
jgi:Glycosyltransferase family 87